MKTFSKVAVAFGAVAMMAGFAIGCSRTEGEKSQSSLNETKQEMAIPDGTYSAQVKAKGGETFTITDLIVDGESVKTTILNSNGDEAAIPNAERIYGTYFEEDAYDVFVREFDNYDCLKLVVETQNGFPNPGIHHYYTIFAGSYDEKGDCWYDD